MIDVGNSARNSSLPLLVLAAAVALLVTASAAFGEELTREEYVARVEPICKKNAETSLRILRGVKSQVKQGALVPAGKRVVRASYALGGAVKRIAEVPRPSADATTLQKWVGYLKLEQSYLRKAGKALEAKNKFKATKYEVELNQSNKLANNTVISFGFDHCRIESSRYL